MDRTVDNAMGADRPAKAAVRGLWVERVTEWDGDVGKHDVVPLYLTLPGRDGLDLIALADAGVLRLTETGAVHEDDHRRFVAIERDPGAVLHLQRKFVALDIRQDDLAAILQGRSAVRFPTGRNEEACRARVVNLDFDSSFHTTEDFAGSIEYPHLVMIEKLSLIHASQRIDWTLLVTLNASPNWLPGAVAHFIRLIQANRDQFASFEQLLREALSEDLVDAVLTGSLNVGELGDEDCQRLLMVVVPKLIVERCTGHGWQVQVTRNLRYGQRPDSAPMVTWIIEFRHDPDATVVGSLQPAVESIFHGVGEIAEDGTLQ